MADAVAGPAGTAIQVTPPDATFNGPFTGSTKSNHTMKNTSAAKVCIKLKVFDNSMVQCKPTVAFMTAGQEMPLNLVHKTFPHNPAENYDKRKVGIFYADAPDTATDPVAFAKDCPAASWKVVKMQCKYVAGEAAPKGTSSGAAKGTSSGAAKAAAAAAPAAAPAAEGAAPAAAPPAEAPAAPPAEAPPPS